MKIFIIFLMILTLGISPLFANGDDDHMGSAGIWIPVMIVGMVVWHLFFRPSHKQGKNDDALETLKKRYASGEITREEYLEMKKDLK